jgi:hypothetical protein
MGFQKIDLDYTILWVDVLVLITTIVAFFVLPYFFCGTELYTVYFIDIVIMVIALIVPLIMPCLR